MSNIPTANDILLKIGVAPKQPVSLYNADVGSTKTSTSALPVATKKSILPQKTAIAPVSDALPSAEDILAKIGAKPTKAPVTPILPQKAVVKTTAPTAVLSDTQLAELTGKGTSVISQAPKPTIKQKVGDFFNRILPGTKPEEDPNPDVGVKIKVPFLNRVISRPQTLPDQILKDTIETPERVASTLTESQKILRTGERTPAPADPFQAKVNNVFDIQDEYRKSLEDNGMKPEQAGILSAIYAGSIGILDIASAGQAFKNITEAAVRNIAVPEVEHQLAWQTLGRPSTVAEAEQTAREVLKRVHPDVPITGNADATKNVLSSLEVIRKQGIPTQASLPARMVRDLSRAANTPVDELLTKGLGPEVQAPYADVAGLLPGTRPEGGKLQPRFGLSTQAVESVGGATASNIPKELGPLTQEISKYKDVADFAKNNDLVFQGVGLGKASNYFSLELSDALGYAKQPGLKGTGEVRAMRWTDIPDDVKTIMPDETIAPVVIKELGADFIGRPLTKQEFAKVQQHVYIPENIQKRITLDTSKGLENAKTPATAGAGQDVLDFNSPPYQVPDHAVPGGQSAPGQAIDTLPTLSPPQAEVLPDATTKPLQTPTPTSGEYPKSNLSPAEQTNGKSLASPASPLSPKNVASFSSEKNVIANNPDLSPSEPKGSMLPHASKVNASASIPVDKSNLSKDKVNKSSISYDDSLQRTFSSADEAKSAADSFQSIDQILDFNRYRKIDELRTKAEVLKDALSNHPAGPLERYANSNGELPEVLGKTKSIFGRKGDDIASELGFKDSEEARASYQRYLADKRRLADMRLDLKKEAEFSKEFRSLERILNKAKPVAGTKVRPTEIAARNIAGMKDISGFSSSARDVYRNFQAVFGSQYPEVKSLILDPFDDAKFSYINDQKNLMARLKSEVIDKYHIRKGSYDDETVMAYGEGNIPYADIVGAMGEQRASQIKAAAEWFRKEYDILLDEVNAVRKKIYPHSPEKLVPRRKDYFHHFREMAQGVEALRNIFENAAGITPKLAGISEFTLPKSRFLGFAQRRLGDRTERSAVGGFLHYIPSFSYAKNIDPQINVFRQLGKDIATALEIQGEAQALPPSMRGGKMNNFINFLEKFSQDLAGKTNPWDRIVQETIPGGRTTMKAINWVNNRVKANLILGNLSSSVAQIFNVPQGIASAKLHSITGIIKTLGGIFKPNVPMQQSRFIAERFFRGQNQFDVKMLDKVKEFGAWVIGVLDEAGTKFIWNSHYEKGLAEGVPDAVRYADEMTRRMVAGRGIGEVPLIQKSKIFQMVAPFQLEVQNLWWVMKDFVSVKDFAAIATLFVTTYLMNRAAEEIRGSDVAFDPINAAIEGIQEFKDETNIARGLEKFGFRMAGEVLSNVPLGQTVAMALPEKGGTVFGYTVPPRKELFGEGDPTRYGGGFLPGNIISDPLYKLVFPFGGVQVSRTYQGVKSFAQGEVKDSLGRTQYEVNRDVISFIKSVMFGKGATKSAVDYRNELKDIYNKVDSAKADAKDTRAEAVKAWETIKRIRDTDSREAAIAAYNEIEAKNPLLAETILDVGREDKKGRAGTDRAVSQLPVKGGSRARYIYARMKEFGEDKDKKREYLVGLEDAGLLSADVISQIGELKTMESGGKDVSPKPEDKPKFQDGQETSETGIIKSVTTYAKAIGTDPATAFNRIFTGQHIRRVDSGAIIVDRMPLSASEAVRKRQGADATTTIMRLDHTIPLQLGGSNAEDNLKLVPEPEWASYTPIENTLGKLLRAGKIDKSRAQELIKGFKTGTVTAEEIFKLKE